MQFCIAETKAGTKSLNLEKAVEEEGWPEGALWI
jgi:hypothetical protein